MNTNTNTDIISKLLVTARALERAGDELFSRFGITLGMYEILMLIHHHVDTTTRLAGISHITLAGITHKTKLMEDKGYIRRTVHKGDRRVWHFSLTQEGQSLLDTVYAFHEEITVPLFAQFPEADKQQMLTFLTATEQHLGHVLQNRQLIAEHVDNLTKQRGVRIRQ